MRVGKNVEHFKAAAVALDSKSTDPVLRYCAVGRQLGYGVYLTLDAVNFVSFCFSFILFACYCAGCAFVGRWAFGGC